jgi:ribulose-5-phosphate 4-epimerase/fuculose-1-phosphate aldolase
MMEERRDKVIEVCREAHQMGLVSGSSGNASFMWDDVIHITATGTNLDRLESGDFAKVTRSGEVIDGTPSKELSAHQAIYNMHDEVTSVFHLHGEYIAAYTCIAEPGDADYPAIGSATPLKVSDQIPLLPYSHTNIKGDYDLFLEGAKQSPIFLQANHGAFIGAATADEALAKAVSLETNMRVWFIAASAGRPVQVLSTKDKATLHNRSYETNLHKQYIAY